MIPLEPITEVNKPEHVSLTITSIKVFTIIPGKDIPGNPLLILTGTAGKLQNKRQQKRTFANLKIK